jgi:multiple sugar transport system ATP-binding protein
VVEPLGSQNLLTVQIGDELVKVATHPDMEVAPRMDIWLRFPADKIRWVDPESATSLIPRSSAGSENGSLCERANAGAQG